MVSLKKVNNPFQPSGVFAGLFDLLCLKMRYFDDPGVKSSSKALNKNKKSTATTKYGEYLANILLKYES